MDVTKCRARTPAAGQLSPVVSPSPAPVPAGKPAAGWPGMN